MANLGHYNTLTILRRSDVGLFVDGGDLGDILLPRKYVTDSMQVGEQIEVFLYNDSEDRLVVTTLRPHAQVGECAYLKVISTDYYGAFPNELRLHPSWKTGCRSMTAISNPGSP